MHRIADARPAIQSLDDAIQVHTRIAMAQIRVAVARARAEKAVADLKARLAESTLGDSSEIATMGEQLAAWILANKPLFEKRRKVQTDFGSFGLQTVSDLLIADEPALIEHILEQGYDDCLKVARTPVKAAIRARIEAGEQMPGCAVRSGDTAVYAVTRSIIDGEVKEAMSA